MFSLEEAVTDKKPTDQKAPKNKLDEKSYSNQVPKAEEETNPYNPQPKDTAVVAGSVITSIILVLFYIFLGILGLGVLLFAAAFVVCMGA
jgi:hypothetical protein